MPGDPRKLLRIRRWVEDNKPKIAGNPEPAGVSNQDAANQNVANHNAVVVTGLAGYFPGCMDVATFFRHIDRDEPSLAEIDSARASFLPMGDDREFLRTQSAGLIPDIASFDAGLFGILPMEAEEMDPRQRLLLMSVWRTLEDAGIDPESLRRSATGVFIGCESNEYAQLMARAGFVPSAGLSQADSMVANRISYHFDLAGPSEIVNATCAGFAVALDRAFAAVRSGSIDRAIVGAANVILVPEPFRVLQQAGQLGSGGEVKSFGKDARGFVRAEGVGTILIERQRDAEAAGRPIYARIRNVSVNFNGQGGVSMAAPNVEAHAELIKACYRQSGIDPRRMTYFEAQGMGLPVADIAEWNAVNRALTELCGEKGLAFEPGFCRVSTLKPLTGHMHSASSLGALLRIIRSFQTAGIHGIAGFHEPSEFCDTEGAPCRFVTQTEPWETNGEPRLAALHSFGSGGNNAHVLLEEYTGERRAPADRQENLTGRAFDLQHFWFRPAPKPAPNEILAAILEAIGQANSSAAIDSPFTELGVDSLSIRTLAARLEYLFHVSIRSSDAFSHPTPRRLASYVASRLNLVPDEIPPAVKPASDAGNDTANDNANDIAIIGMSLRVAGADDHEAFWHLLKEGQCAVGSLPKERRKNDADIRGGFLASIDTFDPLFFGIAPRECETMDPRHRLLLEGAWAAIEDAGYNPESWRGAQHGIFLGIEESDYPVSAESPITSVHGGTAPARIGYFLDTKGPLLAIGTACSSSLVAVHYAARSILNGESDCALAGGCNLICQPERTHAALSRMGNMLSPDGVCYAFDRRANGMVMGEAVGLVVLKRLSHARRDGDPVYAVIKASGINYDGRTNGLTAPSGERQRELYERVRREAGIRPEQISYVVTHGTGTTLGDPIECHALIDAFGPAAAREPWCAITSPKTNIGHTQAASGVVNLIAAALGIHHGAIPPSLNFEEANSDIRFAGGPLYVNTSLKSWDGPERFAGVNSFGHTGTNAHVLLGGPGLAEAVPGQTGQREAAGPAVIVLSAKTERALRESAARLLLSPAGSLHDVAYTLQVGRAAMDFRLSFVARSWDEMRARLNQFLDGTADPRDIFFRAVPEARGEPRESIAALIEQGRLTELAKDWADRAEGAAVDWTALHLRKPRRRVHLPTYPFEKERYWLNEPSIEPVHEILIFEEIWQPAPLVRASNTPRGSAVCVVDDSFAARETAAALRTLAPGTCLELVQAGSADAMAEALRTIRGRIQDPVSVFDLRAVDSGRMLETPFAIAQLIQSMAMGELRPERILIGCSFATALEKCYVDARVGFEKSLRPILPETRFAIVGVAGGASPAEIAARLHDEWNSASPGSVLYEGEARLAPLVRAAVPEPADCPLKSGGTYLIAGGAGELGLLLAEHLAAKYRANLVLTGRSALSPEKRSRLIALIRDGRGAMYLRADLCDAEAMRRAVQAAKERFGSIRGAIHAAGIESTGTILEKSEAEFRLVTGPKMEGVLVLDRVLRDEPLDFLASFSSSAASMGDFGACDYAIGNRFQTAFARYRNELVSRGERRGKTSVVNWPVWKDGGIARDKADQTEFYLGTSGQRALETEEGLALFERLLSSRGTQYLVLAGQRDRVLRYLNRAPDTEAGKRAPSAVPGRGRKPEHVGSSVEECLQWDILEVVGAILKIRRERLRADRNLGDLGFDSMSLAELAEALTRHFAIAITPAMFFGHSTIQKICRYYMTEHGEAIQRFYAETSEARTDGAPEPAQSAPGPAAEIPAPRPAHGMDEPIAIIGMSGRFPQARDVDAMWRILAEGRDVVDEVPADRFDWREFYGDPAADRKKTNGKWGGFMPGIAEFDPLFFEISPRDAEAMDPRQRLLLQEAWNALEDAGHGPRRLAAGKVGVFVGAEEGDYGFLGGDGAIVSNHNGILASRLSYFLDLRGPAMAINTACSSGLVAAHQACQSLRAGECGTAIVAGVNLILTPMGLVAMGQSGMLSKDGKCFVFDQRANGMAPGEAVVAMVLKPLSKAEADGDPIHAVIRASAVNYDGRTNGITAPSGVAQAELLREIYSRPGLTATDVDYIVAHGTGTKLGDPVEINALYEVFRDSGPRRGPCALTSTKSNFGHTFAASGLLSAVSVVKAFQNALIPASLHCLNENDYIKWDESPFFVNKHARPWPRNPRRKRMGAVSAFGMSGTNAHMVFEEYVETAEPRRTPPPFYLLVLSAKSRRSLNERVAAMADALKHSSGAREELERVSCTLLDGRHHFRRRMALVIQGPDDAVKGLEAFAAGEQAPGLFHGTVPLEFEGRKAIRKHAGEVLRECADRNQTAGDFRDALLLLADYYCQGYDPDWSLLFGPRAPRRLHLPAYPFEREHYWVRQAPALEPAADSAACLHPLLHRNVSTFAHQQFVSTFAHQQFASTFNGREPFLADHVVNGRKILPAVGILEMVRAAMERSVDAAAPTPLFEIRNVVWLRPLVLPNAVPNAVPNAAANEGLEVVVRFEPAENGYRFECRGDSGEPGAGPRIHATGMVFPLANLAPQGRNPDELRQRMRHTRYSAEECYASFESAGVSYGPFYRRLRELSLGNGESLARIDLTGAGDGFGRFGLHPGMLDAAFQATAGLQAESLVSAGPRVPFALESMTMFRACPERAWAWARRSVVKAAGDAIEKFDIDLYDDHGNHALSFRGLSTRELAPADEPSPGLSRTLTGSEFFVKDHGGLLPGVVSLEWALAAATHTTREPVVGLRQVVWSHPIHVNGVPREVVTSVEAEGGALRWQVSSGAIVHAQGRIVTSRQPADAPGVSAVDLDSVEERCDATVARDECQRLLRADLGPALRSIVSFRHNGTEALASLEVPAVARAEGETYQLHPSILNGAVQAANLLSVVQNPDRRPPVPFSLESLWIHGKIPEKALAYVTGPRTDAGSPGGGYDILITDRRGVPKVSMRGYYGLTAEPAPATPVALEPGNAEPGNGEGLIFAVPCWLPKPFRGEESAVAAGAGANPLFILDHGAAAWRESVERQWPAAQFLVLPEGSAPDAVQQGFLDVLARLRECASSGSVHIRPIVLAVPEAACSPMHGAIAGLFRTARQEHSNLIAKIVRLPESPAEPLCERSLRALAFEIGRPPSDDPEVRYDISGNRLVASIQELAPEAVLTEKLPPASPISPGDAIWITGGAGGVGFELARYLAQVHKARVILSGRSPLEPAKRESLDALCQQGARTRYVRCDASDPSDVRRVVDSILAIDGRLHGIVHCAGVVEDDRLVKKTNDRALRVLRPKIGGAVALDEATRHLPLHFMAFFSSLTGTFGNMGQADYAGANAFLDAFAVERNRRVSRGERSGRTISIAWPLWRDGGMGLDASHTELLRQRSGMTPMSTKSGMDAFERCLRTDFGHILVLHGDAAAMRSRLFAGNAAPPAVTKPAPGSTSALLGVLTAIVAEQQKIPPEKVEPDAKLPQYGFDSLAFTELATRLNRRFGLDVMPTLFFEKSSLNALAQHLIERYPEKLPAGTNAIGNMPANAAAVSRPIASGRFSRAPQEGAEPEPIAIVGMSGRFPGAEDVDAFWRLIENNRDMVSEVPPDRWDWREIYGDASDERGKTRVNSAGFMAGADQFDAAFFGISPREAIALDPQLRLLMEAVWLTIEDAGYRAGDLAGRQIGVFMGVSTSDYKEAWLRSAALGKSVDGPPLVSHFGIANRISYNLDLRGPSEPVDTACSSSLIAIHRAIEAMRMGHCESALVGGVNLILAPDLMIEASRAGLLSDDGRCRTFDRRATGYGRGEGVAALLLKPLHKALEDGDHVYCLIRASAENHGGKAASPTAPNSLAQQALLVDAYSRAGIDPASVGYIEAHGTGTELGDAVEIDGLKAAFAELYRKQGREPAGQHCALGSVKTNIGHLEAAAGMAGVVKAVQMLRHGKIPGNPHLQNPNPYLRLEGTPFYLARSTEDWHPRTDETGRTLPLRAGVSSFGIGGSNAHVVLEAFDDRRPPRETNPDAASPEAIVLSAKNAESLKAAASKLLDLLENPPDGRPPSLRELAWTLRNGREAFEERLGFVASGIDDVIGNLTAFLREEASTAAAARIHRGTRARRSAGISPEPAPDSAEGPDGLVRAWVHGADVRWREEHEHPRPRRVRLPGYVFDRKRFWFSQEKPSQERKEVHPVAAPPPAETARPVVSLRAIGPPPPATSPLPPREAPPVATETVAPASDSIAVVLAGMLAEVLFMQPEDIPHDEAFIDLGLDSVIGVEWIRLVNRRFGIKLPATKIYDHPNVAAFARYLDGASDSFAPPEPAHAEASPPASLDDILERVQRGSLTVEEAESLISALGLAESTEPTNPE